MRGMDFAAGRIISREDGVVRYAFPMYYLDFETNEPKSQHTYMGYMDFAYEDGKWKVDDCYLSYTKYSYDYYPGGQSVIYAEVLDDLEDELVFDGISVLLSEDDKAVMEYDGKTIDLPIKNPTNKIRKIEKANGNIFISFLGVFEEIETVVVSESTLEIVGSFVSNGYCITEDGWNYVVIERATQSYLIKDKNGELICDCAAVKQEYADDFCLPHIAPIKSVVKTDEGYEISYDTRAYYNE